MDELIPIEQVIEDNPRVKELEKQGYIIKPEKIGDYLKEYDNRKTTLPDRNYWKEKE